MAITVEVINNNVEKALYIFKKKVEKDGILNLFKSKQFYLKPCLVKREKRKNARY